MLANNQDPSTGIEDLDAYVLQTIAGHVGGLLQGRTLELAFDMAVDAPSLVVDNEVRVNFECGPSEDGSVAVVLFQCRLIEDVEVTNALVREVAFTNKYLLSVELEETDAGTTDLLVCGGVLLAGDTELDALHIAVIVRAILEVSEESPVRYRS